MLKKLRIRISEWLETRWVSPAYAGWLLGSLSLFFFAAGTNTMAGWLYVMSGVSFALLGLAAVLPPRSLKSLGVTRSPIEPISAGDWLNIELIFENPTSQPKTLLQVRDLMPFVLGEPHEGTIEEIPAGGTYPLSYSHLAPRRGIYRWHEIHLRTATPLGLFWCRRSRQVPAQAIVYPTVLPLNTCPLVDRLGRDDSFLVESNRRAAMANEGTTRTLRPYRFGDPTRLVHWRSSARYGELRVRELEVTTGGQELIIALDTASAWEVENFEQAAIAAASLYFYASRAQLNVQLWTADTGLVKGNRVVLEALAGANPHESVNHGDPPDLPLIWLTQNPDRCDRLPEGSRWIGWSPDPNNPIAFKSPYSGLSIQGDRPLQMQLQAAIS